MKKLMIFALFFMGFSMYSTAQEKMQYFRAQDKTGINTFETTKDNDVEFDGVKVKIGGANTLQFQALDHENSGAADIFDIGSNFNLATANLDLDVQLYDGMRMHLRTYLSSRHHAQPYVKGGYLQVDRLDFIREDFLSSLMDHVTVKFGHMQTNYGDAHFRRSDNGQTIFNPFVGNYIMDAFTTEIGAEVYYQSNGFIGMLGFTNGKLNQSVTKPAEGNPETKLSLIGKIGYDSQINDDLRLRITGSVYHTPESASTYLYTGDRAGARYYNILTDNASEFRIPRYNPLFNNELTAIMINPFVKYGGLEFFGMLELSSGKAEVESDRRDFTQLGAELLYRFGTDENLYIGGRYNNVTGDTPAGENIDITRLNFGGGWFLTKNVLTKVEYVVQTYDGFAETSRFHEAEFSGIVLEAVISF